MSVGALFLDLFSLIIPKLVDTAAAAVNGRMMAFRRFFVGILLWSFSTALPTWDKTPGIRLLGQF